MKWIEYTEQKVVLRVDCVYSRYAVQRNTLGRRATSINTKAVNPRESLNSSKR
jgi:hypothetical protein